MLQYCPLVAILSTAAEMTKSLLIAEELYGPCWKPERCCIINAVAEWPYEEE